MSLRPVLGTEQVDARFDDMPPRVRTKALVCWRAEDLDIRPMNPGMSVGYRGRSTTATIYDSLGGTLALTASAPAFSSFDWDGDGDREESVLRLSNAEALRFYDATSGQLLWTMGSKVHRFDWVEQGNALVADAPYGSFTNNAVTGAYLAVLGDGTGKVALHHYNGTSTVVSALPVETGDRCELLAQYWGDDAPPALQGCVQISLVRNGGREAKGDRSTALTPAANWGGGTGAQARLNEIGNSSRGVLDVRWFAWYGGIANRQQLLEVL